MNEYSPQPSDRDDLADERVNRLMDAMGLPRAEAEDRLGLGDRDGDGADVAPRFTRQESKRLHPSSWSGRRRLSHGRPPVVEDSEDVATGILSPEQKETNDRGIALVREALRASQVLPESSEERARRRAREERRNRPY